MNCFNNQLGCSLVFYFFVNPLLNENLFQRAGMKLIFKVLFLKFELCLEYLNKLICIVLNNFGYCGDNRFVIFDYHQVGAYRCFAFSKSKQCIYCFVGMNTASEPNFNFNILCGKVADPAYFQFALFSGSLN